MGKNGRRAAALKLRNLDEKRTKRETTETFSPSPTVVEEDNETSPTVVEEDNETSPTVVEEDNNKDISPPVVKEEEDICTPPLDSSLVTELDSIPSVTEEISSTSTTSELKIPEELVNLPSIVALQNFLVELETDLLPSTTTSLPDSTLSSTFNTEPTQPSLVFTTSNTAPSTDLNTTPIRRSKKAERKAERKRIAAEQAKVLMKLDSLDFNPATMRDVSDAMEAVDAMLATPGRVENQKLMIDSPVSLGSPVLYSDSEEDEDSVGQAASPWASGETPSRRVDAFLEDLLSSGAVSQVNSTKVTPVLETAPLQASLELLNKVAATLIEEGNSGGVTTTASEESRSRASSGVFSSPQTLETTTTTKRRSIAPINPLSPSASVTHPAPTNPFSGSPRMVNLLSPTSCASPVPVNPFKAGVSLSITRPETTPVKSNPRQNTGTGRRLFNLTSPQNVTRSAPVTPSANTSTVNSQRSPRALQFRSPRESRVDSFFSPHHNTYYPYGEKLSSDNIPQGTLMDVMLLNGAGADSPLRHASSDEEVTKILADARKLRDGFTADALRKNFAAGSSSEDSGTEDDRVMSCSTIAPESNYRSPQSDRHGIDEDEYDGEDFISRLAISPNRERDNSLLLSEDEESDAVEELTGVAIDLSLSSLPGVNVLDKSAVFTMDEVYQATQHDRSYVSDRDLFSMEDICKANPKEVLKKVASFPKETDSTISEDLLNTSIGFTMDMVYQDPLDNSFENSLLFPDGTRLPIDRKSKKQSVGSEGETHEALVNPEDLVEEDEPVFKPRRGLATSVSILTTSSDGDEHSPKRSALSSTDPGALLLRITTTHADSESESKDEPSKLTSTATVVKDMTVWSRGSKLNPQFLSEEYIGLRTTNITHVPIDGRVVPLEETTFVSKWPSVVRARAAAISANSDAPSNSSKQRPPSTSVVSHMRHNVHVVEVVVRPDVSVKVLSERIIAVATQMGCGTQPLRRGNWQILAPVSTTSSLDTSVSGYMKGMIRGGASNSLEWDSIDVQVCVSRDLMQRVLIMQFNRRHTPTTSSGIFSSFISGGSSLAQNAYEIPDWQNCSFTRSLLRAVKKSLWNGRLSLSSLQQVQPSKVATHKHACVGGGSGLDSHFLVQLQSLAREGMWERLDEETSHLRVTLHEQLAALRIFYDAISPMYDLYGQVLPKFWTLDPQRETDALAGQLVDTPIAMNELAAENNGPISTTSRPSTTDLDITHHSSISKSGNSSSLADNVPTRDRSDSRCSVRARSCSIGTISDCDPQDYAPGQGIDTEATTDGLAKCLAAVSKAKQEIREALDAEFAERLHARHRSVLVLATEMHDFAAAMLSSLVDRPANRRVRACQRVQQAVGSLIPPDTQHTASSWDNLWGVTFPVVENSDKNKASFKQGDAHQPPPRRSSGTGNTEEFIPVGERRVLNASERQQRLALYTAAGAALSPSNCEKMAAICESTEVLIDGQSLEMVALADLDANSPFVASERHLASRRLRRIPTIIVSKQVIVYCCECMWRQGLTALYVTQHLFVLLQVTNSRRSDSSIQLSPKPVKAVYPIHGLQDVIQTSTRTELVFRSIGAGMANVILYPSTNDKHSTSLFGLEQVLALLRALHDR